MKQSFRRPALIASGLLLLLVIGVLVLQALQGDMAFFYSPSQVRQGEVPQGKSFRVGGRVVSGSLRVEGQQGSGGAFALTDGVTVMLVRYAGALPRQFAEGGEVVVAGRVTSPDEFLATEVIVKYDDPLSRDRQKSGGAATK